MEGPAMPERTGTVQSDATRLQPVDEEWSSALAVVAHPDDLEYGMSAAIAGWTARGKKVAYCLATSGEAGIEAIPPAEAGPLREQEQRAAALAVGVQSVEFLGYPDGILEYSVPLRRDVARQIRRHRPDVVITGNHREFFAHGAVNQADHVALGRAAIDAARDAGNRWVFRELEDEGLQPWAGVRLVLVAGSPLAAHGIDVTGHLTAGQASLLAHASYLAGLGGLMADPAGFLERVARAGGQRLGCQYAVTCEAIALR
jgi:LmbE family N-acetylglucosaminyl deacetylase